MSLVIAGLEAQGQAKPAVAQLGLSIDDVKDGVGCCGWRAVRWEG